MKFLLIVVLLLSLMSFIFASQDIHYEDSYGAAGFKLMLQNDNGVNINYSIEMFTFDEVNINGEDLQNILLPNNYLPNDEGAPNIPSNGRYIAIPQGAEAQLRIVNSRTEKFYNIELAPAPRIPLDTEDGHPEYNKNLNIYESNAFYPANPIQLGQKTLIRGVDAVMLGITPFQYNPVTKELIVYRDLEIQVNFIGGNNHFGSDNLRNRWWDTIFSDTFLNYELLPVIDYSNRTRNGAEYLIICPDDDIFLSWADSIRIFRQEQGISTMIKTTDEVGGNTSDAIETYINDIMDPITGWDPAPAAILLLGDHGVSGNTVVSPIYDGICVSDNIYADVSGNGLPDVTLARITATNASQLENMVTKFLNYERTPPNNPGFYNNVISAMGWQTQRWFQLASEIVGGYFSNELGKNNVRINTIYSGDPSVDPWSTNQNTYMILNQFGSNGLGYIPATPAELGGWTGGNATMINNAINNGAFFVQHHDHGEIHGWVEPSYNCTDINGLTNTDLPFVFSMNCLTGKFNVTGECFAEAFHNYSFNSENSGALGVIAASSVSYSFVNDVYYWGMIDYLWPDFLPTYGSTPTYRGILPAFANSAGKYFLEQSNWPYSDYYKQLTYALFHDHGDAFTTVYSEMPQYLTVIHDPEVLCGSTSFTVTADDGALIGLSVNGEIIGVGTATGNALNIPIDPQLPTSIVKIVVTKQNYYRYEASMDVIPTDDPFVVLDYFIVDDSAGNGNGLLDYGETIRLDISLDNVGNSAATNIVGTLSSSDPYITIVDGTENFGNIEVNGSVFVTDAFEILVANDIPDGHTINFELEAAGGSSWISYFSIDAYAPVLEFMLFTIDDTVFGNGDYMWDPGESVYIMTTICNTGSSSAINVEGLLTTTDPYVIINTTNAQPFGDIALGNSGVVNFTATSLSNTPEPHMANFILEITADLGITGSGTFSTQIGTSLMQENFVVFPPTGWTIEGGTNWCGSQTNNAGGSVPEARFTTNPTAYGIQRLISNPINTTGYTSLEFSFLHMFVNWWGSEFELKVQTTSDGTIWHDVWSLAPTGNIDPELLELAVNTPDVGSSTFQIAIVFDGNTWYMNDWWIDNIVLSAVNNYFVGTVSGVVTDNNSGAPLENANIAGLAISQSDGSYSFNVIEGTFNFTCTLNEYFNLTMEDIVVVDGQITNLDFEMLPSDAPENLTSTVVNYNEVELSWDEPAYINSAFKQMQMENTRDLIGYKIYANSIFQFETTELSYTVLALDQGDHDFYVTAFYDDGESMPSNIENVTIILPPVENLEAISQNNDVLLTWEIPQRDFMEYKIYRDGEEIASTTELYYTDQSLQPGNYTYEVIVIYDGGFESDPTEVIIDHTNASGAILPIQTELSGNYPNPFNPITLISFSTKEAGSVSISIYNMKGQLVKTLVNEYLEAAFHEIIWNGTDNNNKVVSSGIYFYKMKLGLYTSTKKMLLLK